MKQSFYLIAMQITSIVITTFTIFFIAVKIPASAYAVVGINTVITSFILVFSNTGIETIGLRNFLFWKSINKHKQIKIITTQAFIIRLTASLIVGILIIPYILFISANKFGHNNLHFFIIFIFSGIFMALNDCFGLILKGHNKFIQSAFSLYIVSVLGKLLALILFLKYGLDMYLYTISIIPLFAFIYLIFLNKEDIDFKYIGSIKLIKSTLIKSKHFAFSSYVTFLISNLDQFIISIFMPVDFIGVFGLIKQIKAMASTFISNFFDPMLQKTVIYKGDFPKMKPYLSKIIKMRNVSVILSVISLIMLFIFGEQLISLSGLKSYPYLFEASILLGLSLIITLYFKIPYYLIATFIKPKDYLIYNIIVSSASVLSFLIFMISFNNQYIFGYFVLSNFIILLISHFTLKLKGGLSSLVNNYSV